MTFIADWAVQTWAVTLEAAPYLLVGFFVAGLIHAWVPMDRVARHLGRSNLGGVLKAALIGAPLPLCSCSVIPVASSIRRQGASRGATASFLISTPETGVDSISITYGMLGPFMAVLRPVAAVLSAVVAGALINRFDAEESASRPAGLPVAGGSCPHCAGEASPSQGHPADETGAKDSARPGLIGRFVQAVRYAYGDMFADLSHWLLIGFVLAGLVAALIPAGFFEQYVGSGPLAMLLILAVALPLYVCATSSTPIAAALIAKGMSPGVALVFLLAGPATNMATMVIVGRELGRRSLVLYLASIVVVALGLGLATDAVLGSSGLMVVPAASCFHGHAEAGAWPFAAALGVLMLNGLRREFAGRLPWRKSTCHAEGNAGSGASGRTSTVTVGPQPSRAL